MQAYLAEMPVLTTSLLQVSKKRFAKEFLRVIVDAGLFERLQ
jgi:hypothetical protein